MSTSKKYNGTEPSKKIFTLLNKVNRHWLDFGDKYIYRIQITLPVSNNDDYRFNSTLLGSLVRNLINGKMSIAGVENRTWFNGLFMGGLYTITIEQNEPNLKPNIHYHLLCISEKDDLENEALYELQRRVQKIFSLSLVFLYPPTRLESFSIFQSEMYWLQEQHSTIHLDSAPVLSIDKYVRKWLLKALNTDVRFFGKIYQLLHKDN